MLSPVLLIANQPSCQMRGGLGPATQELELQTAKDTTAGKPRPMGKRGAFVADHVAGGPDGHKRPVSPVSRDPAAAKPGGD